MGLCLLDKIGQDLRMGFRNVVALTGILKQVEKQWRAMFATLTPQSVSAACDKMGFEGAFADGAQFVVPVVKHQLTRTGRTTRQWPAKINSINDSVRRQF